MTIRDIREKLGLEIVAGQNLLDNEIKYGFTGDLLSVVIGSAKEGSVWITVQSHINIIAVAALVNMPCIIITQGYKPDEDTIKKAEEEEIVLLSTKLDSFEIAKQIAKLGV